jgi:hypothetical protein
MEKRREIPAPKNPNAPSRSDVERVRGRITALGLDWIDACEKAGLGRATAYRLLKGEASIGKLRELEEWVVKEEAKQHKPALGTKDEQDGKLSEWSSLGEELMRLDPARFADTLDGLRDVLASVKLTRSAFQKMFRATPDGEE